MSDIIDVANDVAETGAERAIAAARDRAAQIQTGQPGDCELCGAWSGRLIGSACAPCRDRYKLP
jgi:hypothetical protein